MKIGLFHSTLPELGRKPGGVEIVVDRLARELARHQGDRVTVFSYGPAPADATYEHRRLFAGATWLTRGRGMRLLAAAAALNATNVTRKLDVLHLHGDDWFLLRRGVPTVRTFHGSALHESRTATSWKRAASQRVVYSLEHIAARLATLTLAVGPDARCRYRADWLIDNGVDLTHFSPGMKSPSPSVLFVGTWAGRKRGERVFDLFTRVVRPQIPEAELWMVSDRCEAAPGVTHLPRPKDDELASLYRSAWVFAYPSVYEGFGLPYVEAMASGTAILTSPNLGAAYVLRDGQLGRIVDDDAFAGALVDLLTDVKERQRLELAGRDAAEAYAWPRIAMAHRAAYAEAVARCRPKTPRPSTMPQPRGAA